MCRVTTFCSFSSESGCSVVGSSSVSVALVVSVASSLLSLGEVDVGLSIPVVTGGGDGKSGVGVEVGNTP